MITQILKALNEAPTLNTKEAHIAYGRHHLITTFSGLIRYTKRLTKWR